MARGLGRSENKRAATAYLSSPLRGFDMAGRIDNDAAIRAGLETTVATLADPREQTRSPDILATTSARPTQSQQPAAAATTHKGSWTTAREAFTGKGSRTAGAVAARGAKRAFGGLFEGLFKALLGESPAAPAELQGGGAGPQTAEEYTQEILQRAKAMQALSRVHGVEIKTADQARMEDESAKKRDRDRGGRSL